MRWPLLLVGLILVAACGSPATEVTSTSPSATSQRNPSEETATSSPSTSPTTQTSTSTTSTTSVPTTTTTTSAAPTTASVERLLTLRGDGLGELDLGEPTDSAIEVLVGLLGPPDPGEEYPYGDHPLRFLHWHDVGLAIIFSDYPFFRDDGVEHFAGWTYSAEAQGLRTEAGIGIGSTLADLQSAYPDQVVLEAECDPGGPPTAAYVRFPGPEDDRIPQLRFYFESLPLDSTSRVTSISVGASPGC